MSTVLKGKIKLQHLKPVQHKMTLQTEINRSLQVNCSCNCYFLCICQEYWRTSCVSCMFLTDLRPRYLEESASIEPSKATNHTSTPSLSCNSQNAETEVRKLKTQNNPPLTKPKWHNIDYHSRAIHHSILHKFQTQSVDMLPASIRPI